MIKPSDMDKLYTTVLADKKYPQELNDNFWRWFGNSETVDDNGNPLIFYHGTKQRFNEFKSAYDDGLVYFTYQKEFADDWSKNAKLSDEQMQKQDDYFDVIEKFGKKIWSKYAKKYNEEYWADDSTDERKKDLDEYIKKKKKYEHKIDRRLDIGDRQMPVYIKAEKIFRPERDYQLVIDDILPVHKFEESTETTIKYVKEGHWSYYEMGTNGLVIDKIFNTLGFDAIDLEEVRGRGITTLAVKDNTNQIKSIYNNGDFSPYTNNIYR